MIIKIFAGPLDYNISKLYCEDEEEYIVGVDHGALLLLQNNIKIDLAIGDFDSVTETEYKLINEVAIETLKFPAKKNQTDLYLAIDAVSKMDYDKIIVYGGIGGRFDHSFANLRLLKYRGIMIVSKDTVLYILKPGTHHIKNKHKYISFFALEDILDLTISGFKYEKTEFKLIVDDPLGISNEGEGTLYFTNGLLLVIHQDEN